MYLPVAHDAHAVFAGFGSQPGLCLHALAPALSCHQPSGQLAHDAWPVLSWYLPAAQLEHDPVPAGPLGHAVHALFAAFTAHPAPDLQDCCAVPSCHVFAGHDLQDTCPAVF